MKRTPLLITVLAAILLAACQAGPTPTRAAPCSVQAADFLANTELVLREWSHRPAFLTDLSGLEQPCHDTRSPAGIESCIEMIDVVTDIQRLRQRIAGLDAPDCAAGVKMALTQYMDAVIAAYQASMAQQPDPAVGQKLSTVAAYREQFYKELGRVRATPAP